MRDPDHLKALAEIRTEHRRRKRLAGAVGDVRCLASTSASGVPGHRHLCVGWAGHVGFGDGERQEHACACGAEW